jgi:hypothetical protein
LLIQPRREKEKTTHRNNFILLIGGYCHSSRFVVVWS